MEKKKNRYRNMPEEKKTKTKKLARTEILNMIMNKIVF